MSIKLFSWITLMTPSVSDNRIALIDARGISFGLKSISGKFFIAFLISLESTRTSCLKSSSVSSDTMICLAYVQSSFSLVVYINFFFTF